MKTQTQTAEQKRKSLEYVIGLARKFHWLAMVGLLLGYLFSVFYVANATSCEGDAVGCMPGTLYFLAVFFLAGPIFILEVYLLLVQCFSSRWVQRNLIFIAVLEVIPASLLVWVSWDILASGTLRILIFSGYPIGVLLALAGLLYAKAWELTLDRRAKRYIAAMLVFLSLLVYNPILFLLQYF